MNDQRNINDKEIIELNFEIVKLLDGLTIGRAKYVLEETLRCLLGTHRVNTSNQEFSSKLKEFRASPSE